MDFSDALREVKLGNRVHRAGWNGKGMFLFWVPDGYMTMNFIDGVSEEMKIGSYMMMKTAQGTLVPWLCSQTDMAAEDWARV